MDRNGNGAVAVTATLAVILAAAAFVVGEWLVAGLMGLCIIALALTME